jgi:hypothetical protein
VTAPVPASTVPWPKESLAASLSRWKVIFWRRPSSDPAAESFLYLWPEVHRPHIKDFGVLVAWDEEASSYAAIIIKVRVVSLDKIPHSCVVSDGDNFQAE